MAISARITLSDAVIFTGEAFIENHALVLGEGRVLDIIANGRASGDPISYADKIIAPGFIDCQVNGGGNVLLNNTPTAEGVIHIAKAHARKGTTRLLPTLISDTAAITQKAITAVRDAKKHYGGILGIHLEGPHLAAERHGAHRVDVMRSINDDDLRLYACESDEIMLVTLAPERVSPQQIEPLCAQGVKVSLGHTAATPEQIRAALHAGASCFTHLYNAMGGMSARSPNVCGTALDDATSWCSIIADGHHVSAEMIRLAIHAKAAGKLFLVSDAMPPAASDDPQDFTLYGEAIHWDGSRCLNSTGGLVGTAVTLADCVRHCIHHVGVEPATALAMASTYPAAFLGLDKKFGKLLPDYVADVVVLDHAFQVHAVWMDGQELK